MLFCFFVCPETCWCGKYIHFLDSLYIVFPNIINCMEFVWVCHCLNHPIYHYHCYCGLLSWSSLLLFAPFPNTLCAGFYQIKGMLLDVLYIPGLHGAASLWFTAWVKAVDSLSHSRCLDTPSAKHLVVIPNILLLFTNNFIR